MCLFRGQRPGVARAPEVGHGAGTRPNGAGQFARGIGQRRKAVLGSHRREGGR